jgi:DNA-binding transcriptional ArsR family regulator
MPAATLSAERADTHDHHGAPRPEVPARAVLDSSGELLRALSAPVRIAIVVQLSHGACCVHELVDLLEIPQPLVSQHLRVLKAAAVVAGTRSGREVLYRLVDHHLADIVLAAVAHAGERRGAAPTCIPR